MGGAPWFYIQSFLGNFELVRKKLTVLPLRVLGGVPVHKDSSKIVDDILSLVRFLPLEKQLRTECTTFIYISQQFPWGRTLPLLS